MKKVYNDTEQNDDWMKSLPEYSTEKEIHDKVANELIKNKVTMSSKLKLTPKEKQF